MYIEDFTICSTQTSQENALLVNFFGKLNPSLSSMLFLVTYGSNSRLPVSNQQPDTEYWVSSHSTGGRTFTWFGTVMCPCKYVKEGTSFHCMVVVAVFLSFSGTAIKQDMKYIFNCLLLQLCLKQKSGLWRILKIVQQVWWHLLWFHQLPHAVWKHQKRCQLHCCSGKEYGVI